MNLNAFVLPKTLNDLSIHGGTYEELNIKDSEFLNKIELEYNLNIKELSF